MFNNNLFLSVMALVANQEKFGPHKVDPTRFAGFFLIEKEVCSRSIYCTICDLWLNKFRWKI